MRLVTHLAAADVKRSPALYASVALVCAASTAYAGLRPVLAPDPAASDAVSVAGSLLTYLEVLLSIVVVARIVQGDPLVGTTGFWMTKPIPPSTLLASKGLVLGALFVVTPVVAQLIQMSVYRVPGTDMLLASLQTLGVRTLWLVALMTGAALTPSLFAFSLLAATVAAAVSVAINAGIAMLKTPQRGGLAIIGIGDTRDLLRSSPSSPVVIAGVVSVVALAVLLIVQYRTRRMSRSVPAGTAGMAIACALVLVLPSRSSGAPSPPPGWSAGIGLSFAEDPSLVRFEPGSATLAGERLVTAWLPLRLRGIARGWRPTLRLASASLDVDSTRLVSPGLPGGGWVSMDDQSGRPIGDVLTDVLGVATVLRQAAWPASPTVLLMARPDDLRPIAGRDGAYEGTFKIDLEHLEAVAALPLHRGAMFQDGAYRLVVDGVTATTEIVHVLVHTSTVATVFDRRPRPRYSLFLRSADHRAAAPARPLRTYDLLGAGIWPGIAEPFLATGFDIRQVTEVAVPLRGRTGAASTDGVELVVVRETPAASVYRTLSISRFPVREVK